MTSCGAIAWGLLRGFFMIKIECDEKEIEDFLCVDIGQFLGLKLIKRQLETPAGVIDILAYDSITGVYFVIELKKNRLNADSLAQVLRYSTYLNCNKSQGKRVFVPLLIGMTIDDQLHKSVFHYEPKCVQKHDFWKVYYTLFNYSPKSGITFNWYNEIQYKYETNNLFSDTVGYVESLYDKIHERDCEIHFLNKKINEGM